ncbi:MAG: hypothetical protein ACFFBD_08160 [Candidatus Hodarchaeota archaeon]
MSDVRKLGDVTIENESIRLPEGVLDFLLADEGDQLSFYVKDGQLFLRRLSFTDSNFTEPSSPSPAEDQADLVNLRRRIEDLVQKIGKEMDIKENVVEFSDTLADRLMEMVAPLLKTVKSPPIDPGNMIKSLFGEKGSEMASEISKNLGKVMGGMFDALQNVMKSPDDEEEEEYLDDVEIEDEDIDFDDDEDNNEENRNGFKIDID